MARATWILDPRSVKATTGPDGTFELRATLLDGATPQVTVTVRVSADRALTLLVQGWPGMTLSDFRAWADI
jgi:hypothetical protein